MLVVIQVHVKSPQEILLPLLGPRLMYTLQEFCPVLTDSCAELIMDTISRHLGTINLTHRVTVYATDHEPQMIFLRLMDEFPPELISTLVSLLATQEVTPPILPPEPLPQLYDW